MRGESQLLAGRRADERRAMALTTASSSSVRSSPRCSRSSSTCASTTRSSDRRTALTELQLANEKLQDQAIELEHQADASQSAALEAEQATEQAPGGAAPRRGIGASRRAAAERRPRLSPARCRSAKSRRSSSSSRCSPSARTPARSPRSKPIEQNVRILAVHKVSAFHGGRHRVHRRAAADLHRRARRPADLFGKSRRDTREVQRDRIGARNRRRGSGRRVSDALRRRHDRRDRRALREAAGNVTDRPRAA